MDGSRHHTVDTRRQKDRRALRYASADDLRRDLDGIERAGREGRLRTSGNWTPSQVMNHLAAFMEFSLNGYPATFRRPPGVVRLVMRMFKNRYCFVRMSAGIRIPGIPGGTIGQDDGPFDAAMVRIRTALDRLEATAPVIPNHLFGRMTHAEWKGLNLRHCELHLSFLHPG